MLRSFYEEAMGCLTALDGGPQEPRHISVATGVAAAPMLRDIADAVAAKCENLTSHVYEIKNRWFGESITVSGLLTGRDIAEQLAGCDLGERLLLPRNTLRAEGDLFLCGARVHASVIAIKPGHLRNVEIAGQMLAAAANN
jgi:NifB/MoaA-like Fe-S oxidoreductase